jgi:hypothetical protein
MEIPQTTRQQASLSAVSDNGASGGESGQVPSVIEDKEEVSDPVHAFIVGEIETMPDAEAIGKYVEKRVVEALKNGVAIADRTKTNGDIGGAERPYIVKMGRIYFDNNVGMVPVSEMAGYHIGEFLTEIGRYEAECIGNSKEGLLIIERVRRLMQVFDD